MAINLNYELPILGDVGDEPWFYQYTGTLGLLLNPAVGLGFYIQTYIDTAPDLSVLIV